MCCSSASRPAAAVVRRLALQHRDTPMHRAFARRARRADVVRAQARGLGVRAGSRPGTSASRAGGRERRRDQRRRRHLRRGRPSGRATRLRQARAHARRGEHPGDPARPPCRVHDGARDHAPRRSTRSRPRSAISRAPRSERCRSRSREGQKGSSAMPHKRNPVVCERVSGLARVIRGHALAALENVALWHERDISHSSRRADDLPRRDGVARLSCSTTSRG